MSKTILITGASSGIGKATAKRFQREGWNVVATMRSPDKESDLRELDNVLLTRLDVLDTASIEAAVEAGISKFGRIDVLLNNAGYGAYGVLEATSADKIRRQFDTNVLGLLEVSKAVIPHFRENKQGMIINVSSMGGKITLPLGTLYHGTKFAVEGLSEALSYEMASIGVRVKLVEPGGVKTDFGGRSFDFTNDESLAEYQPLVGKVMAAFGPLMANSIEADVVADTIHRAATDESAQLRYVVGDDAKKLIEMRKTMDDTAYRANVAALFKL
ncbi:MAG: SDR family oxidoreductase [Myxococcales bacterium]|nr:SDR family oxidoreductase [Myxococcales bacterium]